MERANHVRDVMRCREYRIVQRQYKQSRMSRQKISRYFLHHQRRLLPLKLSNQVGVLPSVAIDRANESVDGGKQSTETILYVRRVLSTATIRLALGNHLGDNWDPG